MGRKRKVDPNKKMMDQKEIAIWLGRAMSTSEITLRVVNQLLDVMMLQQHMIRVVANRLTYPEAESQLEEIQEELEGGSPSKIIEQLTSIQNDVKPVLRAVDDSCQKLKEMI